MDTTLIFSYPTWFVGFCVLAGLLYALFLYFRDNTFSEASAAQKRWLPFLAFLRFLGVTTIALLLLSPLIKKQFTDVKKPYIVIAHDNSESITKVKNDTSSLKNGLNQMVSALNEDYEVETYHFGEKVQEGFNFDFTEKVTDLSQVISDFNNRYSNQNVGAIVLATDGIFNQGSNPMYNSIQLDAPVYNIALGDTTQQKDLRIDKILSNKIAYRGDQFVIRVDVSAFNLQAQSANLTVFKGKNGGEKVFTKKINITDGRFFVSEDVKLDAQAVGIQQYSVQVTPLNGEITTDNNYKSIYVDILEGRQKILLMANSPHPDISALKQSIETNKNYETTVAYPKTLKNSVKDFDLVILHGLPSAKANVEEVISKCKQEKIPIWYILSSQSSVNNFNSAQDILKISGNTVATNDSKGAVSKDFNLFTYEGNITQTLEELPPLVSPYGEYQAAPTSQTLLYQKIGTVSTKYPLFTLQQSGNYKQAVLAGEGIWRWRMYDFLKDKEYETVDELISKTIQYLAVKDDKRKFRVSSPKNLYNENEPITFDAELYNDSYELINTPEANISIRNSEGKNYPFNFNKTANAYTLNSGLLPVGDYNYTGKTVFNGKEYTSGGSFSVKPLQLEALNTTANHQMLFALSEKYGGEVVYPNQIDSLVSKITTNQNIKPVLYSTYKSQSVINLKWLFFAILGMLAVEWFLRKFFGGY